MADAFEGLFGLKLERTEGLEQHQWGWIYQFQVLRRSTPTSLRSRPARWLVQYFSALTGEPTNILVHDDEWLETDCEFFTDPEPWIASAERRNEWAQRREKAPT